MLTISNTFKAIVVGKSNTGKTYMVIQWCNEIIALRGQQMSLCILTPNQSSFNQPTWNLLDKRFKVTKIVLEKTICQPEKHDIFIVDDVDDLFGKSGRWVRDLFTVESHHQNSIIFLISHVLNSGSPALRYSTDYIIIKDIPENQLNKIDLLTKEEKKAILDHIATGITVDKGQYRNYSYVVYVNGSLPNGATRLYTRSNIFLWPINYQSM